MKSTKFITAVIVFIGTFVLSTGLVWLFVGLPETKTTDIYSYGFSSRSVYADDIESLLNEDISNGMERDRQIYSISNKYVLSPANPDFAGYTEIYQDYADNSGSLDANDLPRDFQIAWQKHMKSWRDYSDFLNAVRNNRESKKVSRMNFNEMEKGFNTEIDRTWYEVLRVGAKYGAEVNQY